MPKTGSCHCGAVRFEISDDAELAPYKCDCSLCSRRGAIMSNVHETHLKLISGEDALSIYQWNTRIAKHYFCSQCGIYPFHKKRSMPDHFGVNLACLHDFDLTNVTPRMADGVTMPLVDETARPEWPGPRTDTGD